MRRRRFLKETTLSTAALLAQSRWTGSRLSKVGILNPRMRVPVSFIIDDSTALVNMAHFGIPQFGEVFPGRYKQPWRQLPREIPDSFVLEFLEWCDQHGVKGKYSMVPYPACTGWLHRFIPGWTKKELEASIQIVRDLAQPNWDIHSEMISHTRVIDIKTGLPYPDPTPDYMENWEWSQARSADELGEYIAYSLQILKDVGLHCDGVTTPGGFGHRNIPNLALGTKRAVQEIYGGRVAHFFRDVITEPGKSVVPQVMHATDLYTDQAACSVHIIACTGDWFGGWDGLTPGDADRFITPDLAAGRMVEVIDRGEPAIFICHWPGIYYNGDKLGFNIFKHVVERLHQKYDHLIWWKLQDIAKYWAAKEHTRIEQSNQEIRLLASFAADSFTIHSDVVLRRPVLRHGQSRQAFTRAGSSRELVPGTWWPTGEGAVYCFDLSQGESSIAEATD